MLLKAQRRLSREDQEASVHVGVRVPNAGHATASSEWWKAQDISSGWINHKVSHEQGSSKLLRTLHLFNLV